MSQVLGLLRSSKIATSVGLVMTMIVMRKVRRIFRLRMLSWRMPTKSTRREFKVRYILDLLLVPSQELSLIRSKRISAATKTNFLIPVLYPQLIANSKITRQLEDLTTTLLEATIICYSQRNQTALKRAT